MLPLDRPSEVAIPLSIAVKIIPDLPRPAIEELVAKLIECLDQQDGDLDLEPNGDELDGTMAEDEAGCGAYADPFANIGCPISDPDCGIEDEPHDDSGEAEEEEGVAPPAYGIDQRVAPMLCQQRWDIDRNDYAGR